MGLKNTYKTLFDIRILHRYFLDEDNNSYVETGGADKQVRFDNNRQKYLLSKFMTIQPTQRTAKLLRNYKGLFRQYKDGILVALKATDDGTAPFISFDANFYLDFTIEITDSYFENYTKIDWNKNGLIYLSNLDPINYTPGSDQEPPAVTVNFSRLSLYETDANGTDYDINLLKDIQKNELLRKFGVIRIYLTGETGELRLTDTVDPTKFNTTTPEYDMYLKNRRTFWRFRKASDQSILYTTSNRRPLTENGYILMPPPFENIEDRYPNPDAKFLLWDATESEYYSEVFINN